MLKIDYFRLGETFEFEWSLYILINIANSNLSEISKLSRVHNNLTGYV
jgi:hypothetical protein